MPAPIPPLFSSRQENASVLQANGGNTSALTPQLFALQAQQFLNSSFARILSEEDGSSGSSSADSILGGNSSNDPFSNSSLFGNLAGLTNGGNSALTGGLSSLIPS